MSRSMFSAISGLRAHQVWMDVIGNNIANVNTIGFKLGRIDFQDILSQTLRGANGPNATNAGSNPLQIGLGSIVAGVDTIHTQGTLLSTSKVSDLAIQGDGFFIVADGSGQFYTRDGGFDIGVDNYLVMPTTGKYVLGWQADPNGVVDTSQPIGRINIPLAQQLDAVPSDLITYTGNLDASAANGDTYSPTVVDLVDSLGFSHTLTVTFTKTANNQWSWAYSTTEAGATITNGTGTIAFDDQGNVQTVTPAGDLTISFTNGAADVVIPGNGNFTAMTQLDSASAAVATANGSIAGALISFAASKSGEIIGLFSNGASRTLGQLATAVFRNPGGLEKEGENLYAESPNSGQPSIAVPGSDGRGTIASGFLEASNVDLATEFTNMIMAERGFQANSRVITTNDEMLQDLVNIKR